MSPVYFGNMGLYPTGPLKISKTSCNKTHLSGQFYTFAIPSVDVGKLESLLAIAGNFELVSCCVPQTNHKMDVLCTSLSPSAPLHMGCFSERPRFWACPPHVARLTPSSCSYISKAPKIWARIRPPDQKGKVRCINNPPPPLHG